MMKLVNLVILVHKYCGIYDNDNDNDNDNDANANDNDNDHDDDDNGLPGVRNGSPQTRAALGVPAIPANCWSDSFKMLISFLQNVLLKMLIKFLLICYHISFGLREA